MRNLLTHPFKLAIAATAVLGGVLLGTAIDGTVAAYALANGAAGATAAAAAVGMATRGTFASRFTAGLVTSTSGIVALVMMVLGTPGGGPGDISFAGATLVACGILVPVLLTVHDGPSLVTDGTRRPYAP